MRVRLRGLPGAEGAARGRLPHDRRQLEPGDDHDRPRLRRRAPTSSRSTSRASPTCSGASGPTRCCRRSAARPRSTSRSSSPTQGSSRDLGVELLGAPVDVIRRAEDRELFREAVQSCGLTVPSSRIVTSARRPRRHRRARGRPAGVHARRPRRRLRLDAPPSCARQVERGLRESPIGQVLVEESVKGWDEFELEVIRDRRDNVVIVCSIENLDPMGVHTGDSVTVAPQMTLSDEAYQELRDAAIAVIRAVGVETGGSNIQFARSRETGEIRVIEMNPRVSRSSALASKATGYPIAKVAAKLAVGYTLDEIPNDLTKTTPASFEPTLDYVVVKFPRFAFEKFPGADTTLGHADEVGRRGDGDRPHVPGGVLEGVVEPRARRRRGDAVGGARRPARRPAPLVPARAGAAARATARRRASASTAGSTRARARSRPTRTTSTRPAARRTSRPRPASRASSSSAPARTGSARGSSSTTAASTPRRASARSATRR